MLGGYMCGGTVTDGDDKRLVLDAPEDYRTAIWRFKPGRVQITIEPEKDRRSLAANRYHWGVVIKAIALDTGQDPMDIHYDMCDRFLRRQIHYLDAHGKTVEREFSIGSSGLTVREFYEFVEQVRLFAAEFFGLRIPDPDPDYYQEREKAFKGAA